MYIELLTDFGGGGGLGGVCNLNPPSTQGATMGMWIRVIVVSCFLWPGFKYSAKSHENMDRKLASQQNNL